MNQYTKEDVKLGDWIEYEAYHVTVVGFVTDLHANGAEIYTVHIGKEIPERKYRIVFYHNIDRLNDIKFSIGNITELIDLALKTHDKEWFNELSKQVKITY